MKSDSRCGWAGTDPLMIRYHDEEWGVPVTDDRSLFEKLCLEGFQCGLSWLTTAISLTLPWHSTQLTLIGSGSSWGSLAMPV